MRFPDWESRLSAVVCAGFSKPQLCGLFVADCVLAMTGEDFGKGFRGFKVEANALRKLKQDTGLGIVEYAESLFPEGDSAAGNIAIVEGALGISQGGSIYVMGPTGLGFRPLSDATKFLKV